MILSSKDKLVIGLYFLLLLGIMVIDVSLRWMFVPILLLYCMRIFQCLEKGIGLTIILILMTPLGGLQNYYNLGIDFSQFYFFTYISVMIIHIFKKIFLISKIRIRFYSDDIIILCVVIGIIYSFIFSGNSFEWKFIELRMFLMALFSIIIIKNNKVITVRQFLNYILIGISLSSIITLIFYFIIDVKSLGLLDSEGRYSWAYQTLYHITLPILLYKLMLGKDNFKNKIFILVLTIVHIFNLFLSGNRTGFIFTVIICLIVFFYSTFRLLRYKGNELKIGGVLFSIILLGIIAFIVIKVFSGIEGNIVYRVISGISEMKHSSVGTLDARRVTNDYYIKEIIGHPNGFGIGKLMYMYTSNGQPYGLRSVIDSGFLTFGYKFGIVNLILIGILIIKANFNILFKNKMFLYHLFLIVSLLLLIFSGGIMTGQIFNNNAVTIVFWGIIGILLRPNFKNKKSIIKDKTE